MFQSIVVGVDGSAPSERAMQLACALTKVHKAELHIVHAPEVAAAHMAFPAGSPVLTPTVAQMAEAGTVVMRKATEIANDAGVTPATTTIGEDTPCAEIATIVDLYDADLVITGRRGLGSVSGLFMGSTSQKLAQTLECACLTVK